MRNFQAGGLAQVVAPPDPEDDELVLDFDPADVTGTEELIPDPAPKPDLYRMAAMNRDEAIKVLRATQEEFKSRRVIQEKRSQQDRWLAMAQAMLSPTQTGAFGENLGMAAGALRDVNASTFETEMKMTEHEEWMMDREASIASDYFDSLTNLEGFKNNSRARVVGTKTVITPADNIRIANKEITEAEAERNVISIIMQPNGETISRIETDPDGRPWVIVDPSKVPSQAAAQTSAKATASASIATQVTAAKLGVNAIPMVTRLQRAYGLLSSLTEDTSGLNEKIRQVAQWAGISEIIDDNVTLAVIHKMFGAQILQDLRLLTGSKTDFEYRKVEGQNARLGISVEENLGILEEHMTMLNEMVDKGEFAAQSLGQGPGTEEKGFWLETYLRHRKAQAELAAEYDATTRTAPSSRLEELIENIQLNEGNPEEQQRHIEMFREFYDIPDDVQLALRKAGAAI